MKILINYFYLFGHAINSWNTSFSLSLSLFFFCVQISSKYKSEYLGLIKYEPYLKAVVHITDKCEEQMNNKTSPFATVVKTRGQGLHLKQALQHLFSDYNCYLW